MGCSVLSGRLLRTERCLTSPDKPGEWMGIHGFTSSYHATDIVKHQNYGATVGAVLRRAGVCTHEGIGLMFSFDGSAFAGKQGEVGIRARKRAKAMAAAEEVEDEEQRDRLYRVALCITPEELQTFYDVCARANDGKQCAFK